MSQTAALTDTDHKIKTDIPIKLCEKNRMGDVDLDNMGLGSTICDHMFSLEYQEDK